MIGDKLKAKLLSSKLLTAIEDIMLEGFNVPEGHIDIGMFTTDNEDIGYLAADEATKNANVEVCFVKSTYGNAGETFGGEMIGIISGPSVSDVESGLKHIRYYIENNNCLYSGSDDNRAQIFAQPIAKVGQYLSNLCDIPKGSSAAYLTAPPLASMVGVDEALTAADVRVVKFFGPITASNRGGAIVTGTQSACVTAAQAFLKAAIDSTCEPIDY